MSLIRSIITGYQGFFQPAHSVAIANGAQLSAAIDCGGMALCGIKFPAVFTSTAVTFQVCDTLAGTYVDLYNSAGQVSYTIAQGRFYAIDPKDFQGVQFLKIKAGSAEGGARTLLCALKGF